MVGSIENPEDDRQMMGTTSLLRPMSLAVLMILATMQGCLSGDEDVEVRIAPLTIDLMDPDGLTLRGVNGTNSESPPTRVR